MTYRELLIQKVDVLSDGEVAEVLDYIAIMESLSAHQTDPGAIDDLALRLLLPTPARVAATGARRKARRPIASIS